VRTPGGSPLPAFSGLRSPSFLVGCGLLIARGVAILLGCLPMRLRPAGAAVLVEQLDDMVVKLRRQRVRLGHPLARLLGVLMGPLRLRPRLGRLLVASTRGPAGRRQAHPPGECYPPRRALRAAKTNAATPPTAQLITAQIALVATNAAMIPARVKANQRPMAPGASSTRLTEGIILRQGPL